MTHPAFCFPGSSRSCFPVPTLALPVAASFACAGFSNIHLSSGMVGYSPPKSGAAPRLLPMFTSVLMVVSLLVSPVLFAAVSAGSGCKCRALCAARLY